ncbi:restriction endonuclease [Bradyrhizobium elkanii]|uniref:restriction endonuclease n=1 Tax=Bradyrhizobium elkanii TaxID=29448 RepID=UPI001FD9AD78|nr:restriction endonuclease [Bradyrhizobium elkanii]WLA93615.1 restriction endonuclease [Bradyrhizobium elkanii]
MKSRGALRGYVVSTSTFTEEAKESAVLSEKIVLVDIDGLVRWHAEAWRLCKATGTYL